MCSVGKKFRKRNEHGSDKQTNKTLYTKIMFKKSICSYRVCGIYSAVKGVPGREHFPDLVKVVQFITALKYNINITLLFLNICL